MRLRSAFAAICSLPLLLVACGFFPESSFQLASSSRLPRWTTLPRGLSRAEVTMTMSYYVSPFGRTATFVLYDTAKHRLSKVTATLRSDGPVVLNKGQPGPPPGYPAYEVITVGGKIDVVEHWQMEPIFYMTDDPAVWRALGLPANGRWSGP